VLAFGAWLADARGAGTVAGFVTDAVGTRGVA